MKWMQERDLLIAQTLAFVQSVTGKQPDAVPGVVAEPNVTAEPRMEATPIDPIKILKPAANVQADVPVNVHAKTPIKPQVSRPSFPGDFRTEIQSRVANFRAHQERFHREREAFCSATLTKVRAAIGNDSTPPPLGK